MTIKTAKKHILIAAAVAMAAPALLAQPAAAEGGAFDYIYRTVLATETQQEKTARLAAQTNQKAALSGTSDAQGTETTTATRNNHFWFDVPLEEEQHYRE